MKNKKEEQIILRKQHKDTLKINRRSAPLLEREKSNIDKKPSILIYCDGKNTEPSYFNSFGLSFVTCFGEGMNTLTTVKKAIALRKKKAYDEVWCVFDADPKPSNPQQASNFNKAVALAQKSNINIAYSNQAFEYWLILHFNDHQGGKMNRTDYNSEINKFLKPFGTTYQGESSKFITNEIFEILDGIDEKNNIERKKLAINRAERNYNLHYLDNHQNPAGAESSTTVFKLVRRLLGFLYPDKEY